MSELFYVFGIGLTLAALLVSFLGLRVESFPGSRAAFAGVITVFAVLVIGSAAFAVVLSREEKEEREEELAHAAEEGTLEEGSSEEDAEEREATDVIDGGEENPQVGAAPAGEAPPGDEPPAGGETIELTSPESGDLVFDTTELKAKTGTITIAYTNPSPVPHNVSIEVDGETVAEGATVTGGEVSEAGTDLEAGDYVFYCSVPGHRESGMEGTLTVK